MPLSHCHPLRYGKHQSDGSFTVSNFHTGLNDITSFQQDDRGGIWMTTHPIGSLSVRSYVPVSCAQASTHIFLLRQTHLPSVCISLNFQFILPDLVHHCRLPPVIHTCITTSHSHSNRDHLQGAIHRLTFAGNNNPPVVNSASASTTNGESPLAVTFSQSVSDPNTPLANLVSHVPICFIHSTCCDRTQCPFFVNEIAVDTVYADMFTHIPTYTPHTHTHTHTHALTN